MINDVDAEIIHVRVAAAAGSVPAAFYCANIHLAIAALISEAIAKQSTLRKLALDKGVNARLLCGE